MFVWGISWALWAIGATEPFDAVVFEQWPNVPPCSAAQQQARDAIAGALHAHGHPSAHCPKLDRVAACALAAPSLLAPDLRQCAHRVGVTDGELAVSVRTLGASPQALAAEALALFARNDSLTTFGFAQTQPPTRAPRFALVASRRLLQLAPMPKRVRPHAQLPLAGHFLGANVWPLQYVAHALPQNTFHRGPLSLIDGAFFAPLPMPPHAERVRLQLLLQTLAGPIVAAQWAVAVSPDDPNADGVPPPTDGAPTWPRVCPIDPAPASAHKAQQALHKAIACLRKQHNKPALLFSPAWQALAEAHAHEMADLRYFAHVSPRAGDAAQRAMAASVPFATLLENIARAGGLSPVLHAWLHSPSHLANLLDTRIAHIGAACVRDPQQADHLIAVVLLAG